MGEIFERVIPTKPLEWTGERLTTGTTGQVEVEHLHRYFLARHLCRGLDVLDVAAGEGYGTALLSQVARSVVGVEISVEAVVHAAQSYRGRNFRFLAGDARCLPLDDACVDAVVSFETVEHFYEHDRFLAEVRRVLRPGGRFIVSSPERDVYWPSGSNANPHHARELSRAEFAALLRNSFTQVQFLGQRPILGSALVSEADGAGRTLTFERRGPRHFEASMGLPRPVYFVAVASDRPVAEVPHSFYIETAEIGAVLASAEMANVQTDNAARAIALDAALSDTRAQLAAAHADVEFARTETEAARAEAAAAYSQRDIARTAARRAAIASENRCRGKVVELEQRCAEWQHRCEELRRKVAELEQRAAEWQRRYEELRGRLEALLRRFWVLRASRLIPAPARRFVRERLLGWGRQ